MKVFVCNRALYCMGAVLAACSLFCGVAWGESPAAKTPIALYQDKGAYGEGPGSLKKTFAAEADFRLVPISAKEIRAGKLKQFKALIVPGGSSNTMSKTLGEPGLQAIRDFVKEGGAYVGICAGCALATSHGDWSLHLLPVDIVDRENRDRGKAKLKIELTADGQQWCRRKETEIVSHFSNGPVLAALSNAGPSLISLGHYREEITKKGAKEGLMVNAPAIVASTYGKSWVVGVSCHPEQTEGLKDLVPNLLRQTLTRPLPSAAPETSSVPSER